MEKESPYDFALKKIRRIDLGFEMGSINTGLPKDIVKQIMDAERMPITKMEARKEKIGDKKKLVDELTKLTEDIRGFLTLNGSAKSLRELKVQTNNEIIDVAVDKNLAQPTNHQLEVMQLAQKSSAISNGFADKDESYVGVGYIQYTLPNGESKELYVDSENASLNGIAKLINESPDMGLSAQVVNDGLGEDNPWHLLLALKDTGSGNAAEFPYFYFVDGEDDFYLDSQRDAHNAKVKLDGFELEFPDNKLKDLVPGMTIDLKKAKPGEEFSLLVTEDVQAVTSKIKDLVDKMNAVLAFIKKQNTLDGKSDTSRTLGGDLALQQLESRLRSAVFREISTDWGPRRFGDLGVSFQKDGTLIFEEKKFSAISSQNYQMVSQVLTGRVVGGVKEQGSMDIMTEMVSGALRTPDGLLAGRKKSLQSNIDQIDRQVENKQRHLEQKERNLKDKFSRLEGTISKIKGQAAGISGLAGGAGPMAG